MDDEQRIAWARVNWALDTFGEGPEYRQAWAEWEQTVFGVPPKG